MIIECMGELGLDYGLTTTDITEGNARDILLLVIYLMQVDAVFFSAEPAELHAKVCMRIHVSIRLSLHVSTTHAYTHLYTCQYLRL